jgi:hypothetical protein
MFMAQRAVVAVLFLLSGGSHLMPLAAQTPKVCTCIEASDFGGCTIKVPVNYPESFPGSAAMVSGNIGGNNVFYVYIADLFNGFTFRYDLKPTGGALDSSVVPSVFISPEGSRSTTGLAFNPVNNLLYWAIEDRLISTNLNLQAFHLQGNVELDVLQTKLGLPQRGSLGGIAYHEQNNTFWGVDIVNDLYFEFDENGKLILENGQPVYFESPARSTYGGGAYGNGITYVPLGGAAYFDIPVGTLTEQGVSRVIRVRATSGGEGSGAFRVGDPVGLTYEIKPVVGNYDFISGILYLPSTCGPENHTEIVLNIASPGTGLDPGDVRRATSKIYQFAVDDPKTAGLSHFTASAVGNSVRLTWQAAQPYGTLEFSRRQVDSTRPAEVIATFNAPATDPTEFLDRSVADGLYDYAAKVTPPAPNPRKIPDQKQRVVVGLGRVVAHASFHNGTRPTDLDPFAITYIGSRGKILVADRQTGFAHLFLPDLTPAEVLKGPLGLSSLKGLTRGVAWDSTTDSLLWVLELSGQSFVQRTTLAGVLQGTRQPIRMPVQACQARSTPADPCPPVFHIPLIQDVSYDPFRKEFWGIDRANMVAYSFDGAGLLTGKSVSFQLPVPRTPDGLFGGAVAVRESTASKLVLDYTVGTIAGGGAGELARISYARSGDDLTAPGVEDPTLDLRSVVETMEVGGLVTVDLKDEGTDVTENFEYVVGTDSLTIYKLRMESGIRARDFRRGDVNNDGGAPNISDPIYILDKEFKGGPDYPCEDAADLNDDGDVDLTDAIHLFTYLFLSGPPPAEPFPECGKDFAGLGCGAFTCL